MLSFFSRLYDLYVSLLLSEELVLYERQLDKKNKKIRLIVPHIHSTHSLHVRMCVATI